ncbi:MFS transporter [Archangium sp. Cb G35]|uniref:MFS transporter n=1 Tax=Archangium sp. Cb G35 TaxID=1920190 RepID=UPI000ABE32EB|nr:MFS transporter [Archangium sp. Cb G35]
MSERTPKLSGMTGFTAAWLGQMVSVFATQMTAFGVTLWVYERTGSATALGLTQSCFMAPLLLLSPLAGALVDRYDRKWLMVASDLGAGLGTVTMLVLQSLGWLETWHLYVVNAVMGAFQSLQWPAWSAAVSTMVPKEQLGRANGMMSLVEAGPGVLAPLLAGALLPLIHLRGLLVLDVLTFLVAVGTLLMVHVPAPRATAEGRRARGSMLEESLYGFRYIAARPGLLGLQLVVFAGNMVVGMGFTVLAPLLLLRTGNNGLVFGTVQSMGALGGVVGGVLMSAWGGPRRRVHGVLMSWIIAGLFGQVLLGLGRNLPVWSTAMFVLGLVAAVSSTCNQTLWQAQVAPDIQGRVFAARRLVAWLAVPLAPLLAGPLADHVLEPGMREGGGLTGLFGGWVGTGPGAGMALLCVLSGLLMALVSLGGYLWPAVREVEGPRSEQQPASLEGQV